MASTAGARALLAQIKIGTVCSLLRNIHFKDFIELNFWATRDFLLYFFETLFESSSSRLISFAMLSSSSSEDEISQGILLSEARIRQASSRDKSYPLVLYVTDHRSMLNFYSDKSLLACLFIKLLKITTREVESI